MHYKRLIEDDNIVPDYNCHYVYFICDRIGHIKIGITQYIPARLEALQTSNPMKLFLVAYFKTSNVDTSKQLEIMLHHRFSNCRLQGEWFRQKPILRWITNNNIEDLIITANIVGDKVYE